MRQPTAEEWALSPENMLLRAEEDRREDRLELLARAAADGFLPRREWEVIELRFVRGWTQERTADALNLTRQAVRTLEQRAREKLIDLLAKEV